MMLGTMMAAWLDVRSKPIRTLASIAGMVAAITAVIVVDAAANLSRDANAEYLATTYGRSATVSIFSSDVTAEMTRDARQDAADQLTAILTSNGIAIMTVYENLNISLVRNGGAFTPGQTLWVSSMFPEISYLELFSGNAPVETASSTIPHVILSVETAQKLGFEGGDAAGASIQVTNEFTGDLKTTSTRPAVVDAVANSIGTTSNPVDVLVVSDLDTLPITQNPPGKWLVHVQSRDVDLVTDLAKSVVDPVSGRSTFSATRIDQGSELAPVLAQQAVTADAVTVVALLIGGLGILGVGLGSVRERGRDFGLRRALGASKSRVFSGVILQTIIEILLAAAVAVPLAAVIVQIFDRDLVLAQLPLPASTLLPISSAAKGVLAALVVGMLAGLLPALRASRTSVVQALRD